MSRLRVSDLPRKLRPNISVTSRSSQLKARKTFSPVRDDPLLAHADKRTTLAPWQRSTVKNPPTFDEIAEKSDGFVCVDVKDVSLKCRSR